jgi:glycosyltransferase involved in cell wall biosynthesis
LAGASIPLLARLERRVLREATRVYATSPSSRGELASAAGLEEASIEILPIPVDTEYFEPAAPEVWLEAASGPVLTFVGRADDPRKNVRMLLAAFTQLRKEFPGSRLRLVGRPTGYCVPEGVEVVGEVEDLARELAKASLFVLPSRQEGFGIVAAEAMAAGLPVVTTPSGGPEALVRRSGGGVVAVSHSARAFADAIAETVSNIPRLTEMRSLAREYVEREHSPAAFEGALRSALTAVETTS